MINFDNVTRKDIEYNPTWPQIPDSPCRILIIGHYELGTTNALLNLINHQTDKIYLHAKDPNEAKHQLLINKSERAGFSCFYHTILFCCTKKY